MKESKAEMISFLLDPSNSWRRLDIIIGENFRTLNGGSFKLNQTSLADASLIAIADIKVVGMTMFYSVKQDKIITTFEIDLSKNIVASAVAEFIQNYNGLKLRIGSGYTTSVQIKISKEYVYIRLEDISKNTSNIEDKKWLIICFNKNGDYVQVKEPFIPQKRYEIIESLRLEDLTLNVQCNGEDVWDESYNSTEPMIFTWELDVEPQFEAIIITLLNAGIELVRRNLT